MGVRLYDPALGRFLEVDPVEGGSCNDYDYVCGDPVNGMDLTGEADRAQKKRWRARRDGLEKQIREHVDKLRDFEEDHPNPNGTQQGRIDHLRKEIAGLQDQVNSLNEKLYRAGDAGPPTSSQILGAMHDAAPGIYAVFVGGMLIVIIGELVLLL